MAPIALPHLRCYRCLYEWIPRRTPVRACPRCKSRLFDVPKVRPPKPGGGIGIEEILLPHRPEILRLARKHGAKEVRVFGSVRRREADARSDVDLLVRWRRSAPPLASLYLEVELERLLGRRVDVVEEDTLPWSYRPNVLAEAVPL